MSFYHGPTDAFRFTQHGITARDEALDRLKTASAVAKELSQTQSAVSRQLQLLEQQLGQDIITRRNNRWN